MNFTSYLDGLILSDGSVICRSNVTGEHKHQCKYFEWLDYIRLMIQRQIVFM